MEREKARAEALQKNELADGERRFALPRGAPGLLLRVGAQFVKGVYVHKDYEIEIEFNVSFEDFKAFALEQGTQKKQKSEASLLQTSA